VICNQLEFWNGGILFVLSYRFAFVFKGRRHSQPKVGKHATSLQKKEFEIRELYFVSVGQPKVGKNDKLCWLMEIPAIWVGEWTLRLREFLVLESFPISIRSQARLPTKGW
jgi:hypothetical protein